MKTKEIRYHVEWKGFGTKALEFNQGQTLVVLSAEKCFNLDPGLIILQCNHTSLSDRRMPIKAGFDFSQFHTVTSLLHHSIPPANIDVIRSEEHTSELQSRPHLVCRLLLAKKK